MIVIDHLYGRVEVPDYLGPIINAPEVQRLRDIRLLNIFSSTLSSLSEARRFAHSLSVLALFQGLKPQFSAVFGPDSEVTKSIEVACLVHDAATPPFGHLLEYELRSRFGWRHETELDSIIKGRYRPENIHHQLYYGNQLKLHDRIRELGLDPNVIFSLVKGEGLFGGLISGTVDLDNIDNVFRMHSLLGLGWRPECARGIIDGISVSSHGIRFRKECAQAVKEWADARKKCYEVLVFDRDTFGAQAMLSRCFELAIEGGHLGPEKWHLTDDEALKELLRYDETRGLVKRLVIGEVYDALGLYWFDFDQRVAAILGAPGSRKQARKELESFLGVSCLLQYFEDNGTFSKDLDIFEPAVSPFDSADFTTRSRSIVIGVFSSESRPKHRKGLEAFLNEYFGLDPSKRRDLPDTRRTYGLDYQERLPV